MLQSDSFEDFLGEEAVDLEGTPVGTFACYWESETHRPILLGINLPEFSRQTHLVPAKGARLNESQSYVRLAYPKEKIKNAPCLDCECELDGNFERSVYEYYGMTEFAIKAMTAKASQRHLRRVFPSPEKPSKTTGPSSGG